jgi:2'-5' RNA ligase
VSDERIRLFCALQLPDETVARVVAWQSEHLRDGRIVPPENLHVTLAFLGSRPAEEVPAIMAELRAAAGGAGPIELRPEGYRETRSVGMIVLEDVGGAATALADDLAERLEGLGAYRREARPWLPHLTVLRFKKRAGLSPEVGNIRSINVVRSALYRSVLGRGSAENSSAEHSGARYDALETAALGGR